MPMVALAFLRSRRQGRLSCGRRSGGAQGDHPPVTPTLTNPWHWVTSADGVRIGLLTAGSGPGLLLHGGMGTIQSWQRMWGALTTGQRRVTAMDRRGRGSSGDADNYELSSEYADVAAVAAALAGEQGGPVDVAGHSNGATCVLGAAALGAPFRRIALCEPPGPQATQDNWPERVSAMVAAGQVGRATFTFLTEIVGLTRSEVETLHDAPGGRDVLPIVAATLPREAWALAAADLAGAARQVRQPVLALAPRHGQPAMGEPDHARACRRTPGGNRDGASRCRARGSRPSTGSAGDGGIALSRRRSTPNPGGRHGLSARLARVNRPGPAAARVTNLAIAPPADRTPLNSRQHIPGTDR